ncbi:MAG TPA: DUF72 domain-containing protein [Candidatus Limnocylindrales bacterium]|nr:DUF72 domain-containing protein [Candidatus Limnocylindrales bacterium]
MSNINIGTSGWSYKSWEKCFYPEDVPKSRHLEFYATQFSTVEINATFYRLPSPNMVQGWKTKAAPGFIYAVKGSRFITHMKKLANLNGALDKFFDRIEPMKRRIGAILWQLPPILRKDLSRLDAFMRLLPRRYHHAIEFRHPSWVDEEVFHLLRNHRAAHVSLSSLAMPTNLTVTSDLVYIRFHGLEGGAAHDYTRDELKPWAAHIRRQAEAGKTVYAFFNNDANVRAPYNAQLLIEMVTNRARNEAPAAKLALTEK